MLDYCVVLTLDTLPFFLVSIVVHLKTLQHSILKRTLKKHMGKTNNKPTNLIGHVCCFSESLVLVYFQLAFHHHFYRVHAEKLYLKV